MSTWNTQKLWTIIEITLESLIEILGPERVNKDVILLEIARLDLVLTCGALADKLVMYMEECDATNKTQEIEDWITSRKLRSG